MVLLVPRALRLRHPAAPLPLNRQPQKPRKNATMTYQSKTRPDMGHRVRHATRKEKLEGLVDRVNYAKALLAEVDRSLTEFDDLLHWEPHMREVAADPHLDIRNAMSSLEMAERGMLFGYYGERK